MKGQISALKFAKTVLSGLRVASEDSRNAIFLALTSIDAALESSESTIHILQVFTGTWIIVGCYETHEKAEIAATVAGYTNWWVSEWGVL